jgi:hypothetical protein
VNLLEIPHFGWGKYVNKYVKTLLALVHGGIFWLDMLVLIDVYFIAKITGLPTYGKNLAQYLDDKIKEKTLSEEMKENYGTMRGSRGIIINRISDLVTRLETNFMTCKLISKCCKEEEPTGVIVVVAQCMKGTILSWSQFFLNLFLDYF